MDRSVAQIGDELYALVPGAFTAARDGYAGQARADGDTATAKEIAAFKRPTVVGFLVNIVALRHPEAIDRLLALAGRMRAAATNGALLRELSGDRRREIGAILALATELAGSAGAGEPTRAQLADVESTLSAALVDESVAALVRSGRVLKALSYAGFGSLPDGPGSGSLPDDSGSGSRPDGPGGGERPGAAPTATAAGPAAEDAAAKRASAEDRRDRARAAHEGAQAVEAACLAEVDRLAAEIAALREQLAAANTAARAARQARLETEKQLASAERRLRNL